MAVAVVTGGSRGIGAETAVVLAERGWDVCLSFVENEQAAAEVIARCEAAGRKAVAHRSDVSRLDDVEGLFRCADELGLVTALVNNAGIVASASRVDEMSFERIERMFSVNAIGPLLCSIQAVRRMSTNHGGAGGSIVNVSSAASRIGSPGQYVDYAASKGAVDSMTLGLAKEVAGEGIRVNGVRPGIIDTDIHASGGQPDRVERLQSTIPIGRAGQPIEIARTIAWLCSDDASYVTGAILDVSGGR